MRILFAALILGMPIAATAQPAPSAGTGPADGRISRDQFMQRASAVAARRFDAIDVNHTGFVTRDQLRAWRQAHQAGGQPLQ